MTIISILLIMAKLHNGMNINDRISHIIITELDYIRYPKREIIMFYNLLN
jgi:hypothetical protein